MKLVLIEKEIVFNQVNWRFNIDTRSVFEQLMGENQKDLHEDHNK